MNEKKKDTISMQMWLPTDVYEKVMGQDEATDRINQCDCFRKLLLTALYEHMDSPEIPLRIINKNDRRPVAIPITIARTDYTALSDMSKKVGLSKKKLAEVLICGEVL